MGQNLLDLSTSSRNMWRFTGSVLCYVALLLKLCTGWPISLMKTSRWLSSDSFGSWWAATIAAYCPGRMAEHLKSKSTGGFHQGDGSPCIYLGKRHISLGIKILWASVSIDPLLCLQIQSMKLEIFSSEPASSVRRRGLNGLWVRDNR